MIRTDRVAAFGVSTNRDTGKEEAVDILKCNHCQAYFAVKPGQNIEQLGGFCRGCMGFMCARCTTAREAGGPCTPFMAKIEANERADRLRRQLLGLR